MFKVKDRVRVRDEKCPVFGYVGTVVERNSILADIYWYKVQIDNSPDPRYNPWSFKENDLEGE